MWKWLTKKRKKSKKKKEEETKIDLLDTSLHILKSCGISADKPKYNGIIEIFIDEDGKHLFELHGHQFDGKMQIGRNQMDVFTMPGDPEDLNITDLQRIITQCVTMFSIHGRYVEPERTVKHWQQRSANYQIKDDLATLTDQKVIDGGGLVEVLIHILDKRIYLYSYVDQFTLKTLRSYSSIDRHASAAIPKIHTRSNYYRKNKKGKQKGKVIPFPNNLPSYYRR